MIKTEELPHLSREQSAETSPASAPIVPHLLLFEVGPVQDFIGQARSTRDCWSGSFLISWLMTHALIELRRSCPQAEVIYPSTSNLPLLTQLQNASHDQKPIQENLDQLLTPNLPNVLCAVLHGEVRPADVARKLTAVFAQDGEWGRICNRSLEYLQKAGLGFTCEKQQHRFELQWKRHWQVTWCLMPQLTATELAAASTGPVATLAPDGWTENYRLASSLLSSRRNLRHFSAWHRAPGVHRDYFSGREDVVADTSWLKRAQATDGMKFLFREDDELGAVNLIKRVWPKCRLIDSLRLSWEKVAKYLRYDSVVDIAANPWRKALLGMVESSQDSTIQSAFHEFVRAARLAREWLPWDVANTLSGHYIDLHPSIFRESLWTELAETSPEAGAPAFQAVQALRAVQTAAKIGTPGQYYAALSLDGDEMGKWLAGSKTGGWITKEQHLNLSSSLSLFALAQARLIVEKQHHGVLIFAGGDDVLAILPASEALACAKGLMDRFAQIQPFEGAPYLTCSVGIAMGHCKTPLQDMLDVARRAQKAAKSDKIVTEGSALGGDTPKGLLAPSSAPWRKGRDSLAVTLFTRSGKSTLWSYRRGPEGWDLLELFRTHYRRPIGLAKTSMPISSRFPHRLAELLLPYGENSLLDSARVALVQAEFDFLLRRQVSTGHHLPEGEVQAFRDNLSAKAAAYLAKLMRENRTVGDFLHLFSIESFIARQGD